MSKHIFLGGAKKILGGGCPPATLVTGLQ